MQNIIDFISKYQLNIMLGLSCVCGTIAVFVMITKTLSKSRRRALLLLELSSMCLLCFDRLAYMYSGNPTTVGYVMVRLTNFMVFTMTLLVSLALNLYITDLFHVEIGMEKEPLRLKLVNYLCFVGIALIIVSQFTGLYYYFDEANRYHRGQFFIVCYVFPVLVSLIQLSVIIQYQKAMKNRLIALSLILFIVVPLVASLIQIKAYGLSLTNMSIVGVAVYVYIVALFDINAKMDRAKELELQYLQEERRSMQRLLDQTAMAFVNAVDLRDVYTKGHSGRVAMYARELAELSGKDEKECSEVYYAGLLHDIGKISIPDRVLKNDGRMSKEEYEIWKTRSVIGNEILSGIEEYPFLRDGAHYVHERYDGSGYPEGLKGEDIPEIARIVAVADYYDALTSKKSYRDAYPQMFVREAFVKGSGTLFDPQYAGIMLDLIDSDKAYTMREESTEETDNLEDTYSFKEYRSTVSKGIPVERTITKIRFRCEYDPNSETGFSGPSLILFDSFDGKVHENAKTIEAFRYLEFAEIWFDGHTVCTRAKNVKSCVTDKDDADLDKTTVEFKMTIGRYEDHIKISMDSERAGGDVIIALPDSSKYSYVGLTGEYCTIRDIEVSTTETKMKEEDIPRISPKESFINRRMGDLPNLQVDRFRSATTRGIMVVDGMRMSFYARTLPTATFVWHCPYIVLFTSRDKMVFGEDYREHVLIKLNGECECPNEKVKNEMKVITGESFTNWDDWKEANMKGQECDVIFEKRKNIVLITAQIGDVVIENKTTLENDADEVYVALTGDCCAITTIRIK